jgi:signal transduction histidine kinase
MDEQYINSLKNGLETKIFNIAEVGEVVEILVPLVSYNNSASYTFSPVNPMLSSKTKTPQTIGMVRVGLTLERIKYQISKVTRSIIILTMVVIFAAIIISIFLIKIIIRPIDELVIGTKQIAGGALDYRVPLTSKDEFRDLAVSFNSMASDMEFQIKELNKEKKKLLDLKIAFEERSKELEETLKKVQSIQKDLINSEKFATIGRLSSSVAHELRNPLASIKNISYFLLKMGNYTNEKEKKMIQMLSDEVVRANKIITELLDYSKTKQINKLEIDLMTLIDNAIKSVPVAENIKVISEVGSLIVFVDPDRIVQVLINLIANARDAMPPTGGTITLSASKTEGNELSIKVKDNASGMSEETLAKLFEPLFTTKLKGIGLGLPIVKEIIEAHGGKIFATSTLGVGTEFTILLPMA